MTKNGYTSCKTESRNSEPLSAKARARAILHATQTERPRSHARLSNGIDTPLFMGSYYKEVRAKILLSAKGIRKTARHSKCRYV